jgi:AcrR family transcriptional regulator
VNFAFFHFNTIWYGVPMARSNRQTAKARFGREDWIELGLTLLGRRGPAALTLEQLTASAKKTRGSFYHHFEDHPAFLKALGEHWLAHEIEAKIAEIDALTLTGNRREALARHAAQIDHAMERELRRLAASEPAIAAIVARADDKRIAYLVRLFRSELGLDASEALARARIQHSFFVGAQMIFPGAEPSLFLKLQKTLGATLWRK